MTAPAVTVAAAVTSVGAAGPGVTTSPQAAARMGHDNNDNKAMLLIAYRTGEPRFVTAGLPGQKHLTCRLLGLEVAVRLGYVGGGEDLPHVGPQPELVDARERGGEARDPARVAQHVQRVQRGDAGVLVEQLEHRDARRAHRRQRHPRQVAAAVLDAAVDADADHPAGDAEPLSLPLDLGAARRVED